MSTDRSEEELANASPADSPAAPPPPPAQDSNKPEPDPPSIEPRTQPSGESASFPSLPDPKAESEPIAVAASIGRDDSFEDDVYDEDEEEFEARKIKLSIARIDTWSTLKLSFLLSVAIGIGIIVAAACVWLMLDSMAVFTKIDDLLQSVGGDEAPIEILQYFEFNKVISLATIIAVADVIIITLIATLGSVIYNLVSSLIGGLNITLTDE